MIGDLSEFDSETLRGFLDELQEVVKNPIGHTNVRSWGIFSKLHWWGGRWLSNEAVATVAMKIAKELYRRDGFDHRYWSTIIEHGQSGYFYEYTPEGPWYERPLIPYTED